MTATVERDWLLPPDDDLVYLSVARAEHVSVVMPVFDAAEYVGAAIESILRQTYAHFELIVVDDGSTGGAEPTLFVASINTDENPRQYTPPVSALRPVSIWRYSSRPWRRSRGRLARPSLKREIVACRFPG